MLRQTPARQDAGKSGLCSRRGLGFLRQNRRNGAHAASSHNQSNESRVSHFMKDSFTAR
jgi:hypothetical protein